MSDQKNIKDVWGKAYHRKVSAGWDNGAAALYADQKEREYIRRSREHVADESCWCEPTEEYPGVWIHKEVQ